MNCDGMGLRTRLELTSDELHASRGGSRGTSGEPASRGRKSEGFLLRKKSDSTHAGTGQYLLTNR